MSDNADAAAVDPADLMRRHLAGRPEIYPVFLVERFPHVVARMAALWGKPEFEDYFNTLMTTGRPGRQGFPVEAGLEIFHLGQYHDAVFDLRRQTYRSAWDEAGDADDFNRRLKG